jgi:hypothetical protein
MKTVDQTLTPRGGGAPQLPRHAWALRANDGAALGNFCLDSN